MAEVPRRCQLRSARGFPSQPRARPAGASSRPGGGTSPAWPRPGPRPRPRGRQPPWRPRPAPPSAGSAAPACQPARPAPGHGAAEGRVAAGSAGPLRAAAARGGRDLWRRLQGAPGGWTDGRAARRVPAPRPAAGSSPQPRPPPHSACPPPPLQARDTVTSELAAVKIVKLDPGEGPGPGPQRWREGREPRCAV